MGKNNRERRKYKNNKEIEKQKNKARKQLSMFNDITIYLDESGASGINYVDEVQPFYIQAGVIVQSEKIKKLEKVYLDWEEKYKKKNQVEIKSDIFNKDNGFVIFNELYEEARKYIISPTYAFVDKKYAIAFTLIESLLDFDHNSLITKEVYYNQEKKVNWANQIYKNIDYETLNLFNTSRGKFPTKNDFKIALDKLCGELIVRGLDELGELLMAGDREYGYRFYSNDEDRKKASVNVLVFKAHYNLMRQEFYKKKLPKATIIHDEQLHYSKNFLESIDLIESMPLHDFQVSNETSLVLGNFMDIKLEFSDASKSPILKLADLICGYFRYSLERIFKADKDFSDSSKPLFYLFWTPILRHDPSLNKDDSFPMWYYEGLPISRQRELYKYLFDFFKTNKRKSEAYFINDDVVTCS